MAKLFFVNIIALWTMIATPKFYCPASGRAVNSGTALIPSHILSPKDVDKLLKRPVCLESFSQNGIWRRIEDFPVQSKGITLAAELYLPEGRGPWPVVILVPGGFNQTELIMRAPRYDAPRLAHCGYAAVVYYKRGTGKSGGLYAEATYDDFIDDVGNIAKALAQHPDIDPNRIGTNGGSDGGFVASIAAARYPEITFAVNRSGPVCHGEESGNYNMNHSLRARGYADSLVDRIMPLWRRHHAAWAHRDTTALASVAVEIREMRERYDPFLLPTPYDEVFTDSGLVFLWPQFRSAGRDYISEMENKRGRYLCIYGENDPIVPVTSCVKHIERLMEAGGNRNYDIIILPEVDHSFFYPGTRKQVPVIRIMINWLNKNVKSEK